MRQIVPDGDGRECARSAAGVQARGRVRSDTRPVTLVDSDWNNVHSAREEGLQAVQVNILSEHLEDDLDLGGIGRILAITPNSELNTLAALHFTEIFVTFSIF